MESTTANHKTQRTGRMILASGSPRRRELMRALDTRVDAVNPSREEGSPHPGETPAEFVSRLSYEKAQQISDEIGGAIVLGADTAVVLDGEVLGKPATEDEATRMLQRLRGRVHTVVTGVTAVDGRTGRSASTSRSTDVEMRNYSQSEVAAYVASGEPMDKAGAYAVQDETFHPVREVRGCYLNVVGFPMCEVVELLEALGARVDLKPDWRAPEQCDDCPLGDRPEVSRS